MDLNQYSQAAGYAALFCKIADSYIQIRLPDAKRIRAVRIPYLALSSASHALRGEITGAVSYGIAFARSASRFTSFGQEKKLPIAVTGIIGLGTTTIIKAEEPSDYFPLLSDIFGTTADYTSQGRYQRSLMTITTTLICAYAASKSNNAMTANALLGIAVSLYGTYKYDIKNAAGLGEPNAKHDIKSYIYGILHNAPTGANPAAQVDDGEGAETLEEKFAKKLRSKNNPWYVGQQKALDDLTL